MAMSNDATIQTLKLTLVGDGSIGKSCLILQYLYGDFVEEYEPTKADAYRRKIQLQGEEVQIDILDTAGQEDYPTMRDRYLKHGEGFLLIFDLTNYETFNSINRHRDNIDRVKSGLEAPMLLVGNKKDLAEERKVNFEEARSLATRLNVDYIETSAKTRENVDSAFSQILIKIKEMKERQTKKSSPILNAQPAANTFLKTPASSAVNNLYDTQKLTPQEERELRDYSKKKRIKKFYQNLKKKCTIS